MLPASQKALQNAVVWTQVFQKNIQYRGEIDQEGGIFLMEYAQTQSCCAYVLLFLCVFLFFSLLKLTGRIQRQSLAPQFSEWFVGCVAERQTEKRQLKKKALSSNNVHGGLSTITNFLHCLHIICCSLSH